MKPHADKTADDAWQDDDLRLELKRLQKELDDCRRQLAPAAKAKCLRRWPTPGPDSMPAASSRSSRPFIPPSQAGSAWAFPYVAPSSRIMEAASGPLQPMGREQLSMLPSVRLPSKLRL